MILASIKPYYYYLIAEEKKKIEVRKTALKNLPQDIAFYMSKDEKSFAKIPKEFQEKYRKHFGKVGIEFTCDKSICLDYYPQDYTGMPSKFSEIICKESCLSYDEIMAYKKEKPAYGWHISNLKVSDEPKKLSEFRPICKFEGKDLICNLCPNHEYNGGLFFECRRKVTRPPQSYMFVEEVEQ